MNTFVLGATQAPIPFSQRVEQLRARIRWLRLSRKREVSDEDLAHIQIVAREKVANIIEFTLIQKGIPIVRERIEVLVEKEFNNNPILRNGHSDIEGAQREFVKLLEWKRVQNKEVRLWIAQLVNLLTHQNEQQA